MSGRPAAPSYTVPNWSGMANYPAGVDPWSGTPTRVTPGYTYLTPSDNLPAQHVNHLLNERDGVDADAKSYLNVLLAFLGQHGATDWPYRTQNWISEGSPFISDGKMTRPVWDPTRKIWLVGAAQTGSQAYVWKSGDAGLYWTIVGSSFPVVAQVDAIGVITDGGNAGRVVHVPTGAPSSTQYTSNLTAWTTAGTPIGWNTALRCKDIVWCGGVLYAFGADPAGVQNAEVWASSDGNVWFDAGVPSGLYSVKNWQVAVNDARDFVLAVPMSDGTNTRYVYDSGSGLTAGSFPSAIEPKAVCWHELASAWFVFTTAGTIYKSSTGLTGSWSLVTTSPATVTVYDCWVLGSLMVATGLGPSPNSVDSVLWSTSAGASWNYRPLGFDAPLIPRKLGGAPHQVMLSRTDNSDANGYTQSSLCVGEP